MLLAVYCLLTALDIKARPLCARVKQASPAVDAHNAVLSMVLAVHRVIAARNIIAQIDGAWRTRATPGLNVWHALLSLHGSCNTLLLCCRLC